MDPVVLPLSDADLLLRDVLPGHELTACVPRSGGLLSHVHEVRFADGAGPVIVKIYAEAWRQAKETHVYQVLDRHLIEPIPRVLHAGTAPEQLVSRSGDA